MIIQNTTYQVLKENGWTPDRTIDTTEITNLLLERGYRITDSFLKFYKEFGNLEFEIEVKGNQRFISFDVISSFLIEYDEVIIEDYTRSLNSKYLVIIGRIGGDSVLVIDENEEVFSLYGGSALKIGKGIKAIDNLFSIGWREFEEHPIPDWW